MNIPLAGESFDLTRYQDMSPVDMMLAMRRDLEFKMPPVGRTEARCLIGGVEYRRITWRCDAPNCWYMVIVSSDGQLDQAINRHKGPSGESSCPTAPRRESLPSGLAEIEKLWREVDDVIDAIKSGTAYRKMEGEELRAYVKGLAFSIVMKDTQLWPDTRAVAAQALKRWRMRQGTLPFEATPTRHSNDFSSIGVTGGWAPIEKPAAKKAAPRKVAPRKAAQPVHQALPASKERDIRAARASGMFSDDDIAAMYSVPVSQVQAIR